VASMRSGASEYLDHSAGYEPLLDALTRYSSIRGTPGGAGKAKVFTFLSAKGGAGCTTAAVNTAVALQQAHGDVVLVDFAPIGHAALHLNLRPQFGVLDALQNLHRLDVSLLDGLMTPTKEGMHLLAGPQQPYPSEPTPGELARLFDLLVNHYRFVVVDASSRLDPTTRLLSDLSNAVLVVAQTDVVSLWSAGRIHAFLEEGTGRDRLRMAIEKSGKKHSVVAMEAGITRATLSRVLTATHENPTLGTIVKIAHAIDESVGWILDEPSYALSADEQRKLHDVVRVLESSLKSATRQRPKARAESNAIAIGANREIPRAFAAAGARLIYEAAGDSMIGAAIADRDLLFVKPTNNIREAARKIVVCRVGADEYAKHLEVRNGRIRLLSRNERHGPIEVRDGDDFELIGIVVGRAGAPVT